MLNNLDRLYAAATKQTKTDGSVVETNLLTEWFGPLSLLILRGQTVVTFLLVLLDPLFFTPLQRFLQHPDRFTRKGALVLGLT